MTIQEMFSSLKRYGYVADNKIDGNGAEHGNDGRFVAKGEKSNSTKNAEKLSLNMWGNTAEVIKQAIPIRSANSFSEARNILKNIVGKKLKSKSGLPGNISNKSIEAIDIDTCKCL